jgi:FAD:protein FMN transferase
MPLYRFAFRAMAAENEVQLHAPTQPQAAVAAQAAIEEVRRIEAKYSRYRPDSIVSRINAAAGGDPVPVDDETRGLLEFADACFRESDGLFDPTSGILRRAWNFEVARVPTEAELAPLLARIGWGKVERGPQGVRLAEAGMELDFGGFGKEYAVDRAIAVLVGQGVEIAMVNLAGDLAITAPLPRGEPWRVGVRHPRQANALAATIAVASGALATSGDYERFLEVGGLRHCHILDPRTGRSARGFRSVTVLAPTCLVAGAATTVAMLRGEAAGAAWLERLGLAHHAIRGDGSILDRTGGPEGRAC